MDRLHPSRTSTNIDQRDTAGTAHGKLCESSESIF
jgi:hypothetical protein